MMAWPQLIIVVLMAIGLGVAIAKHGEARSPHSAGVALIAFFLNFALLWWGGFFNVWLS